jgi:hypothetical protein
LHANDPDKKSKLPARLRRKKPKFQTSLSNKAAILYRDDGLPPDSIRYLIGLPSKQHFFVKIRRFTL